jgi:asparagine synthase (glutamine-hydrolysing)
VCGLAGYRKLSEHTIPFDQHRIHDLHASLDHRGPDGYGTWVCTQAQIALVHRRLSIIDLSDAGHQPMFDQEQLIVLVFNGEIYNYQLLRAQLCSLGYVFISSTDTEVVIAAYKQWGIACINRFEGMFAFALFDQRTQDLYLVRDRFGIKPLYFSVQNQYLSFASELKALWHLPWINKKNNYQAAYHYLTYLATPAPLTMYEDIYKLPAGFYLHCTAKNQISFHRWYDLATAGHWVHDNHGMSEQDHIDTIRTLLRSSIAKHMQSDVPVGVFLSGGLDSSLTVALMAEHTHRINTFNVSFDNAPELAERDWARLVSRQFNTQHHELILSETDAFDTFEQLRHYADEPLADTVCVPLFAVARAARESGVTVVQIGEGADELFCGYASYVDYMRVQRWWGPSQRYVPAVLQQPLAYAIQRTTLTDTKRELLHNWQHGRSLFCGSAIGFGSHKKKDIWHADGLSYVVDPMVAQMYPGLVSINDSYAFIDYHRSHLYASKSDVDFLQEIMYLEFSNRVPELLLMRADTMTMAFSLEARVPFLDHHLVEYAFAMPQKLKYAQGLTKYILKKASEGLLPPEVIYRKKMGFAAPATHWFRSGGYFKTQLQDLLNSPQNVYAQVLNKKTVSDMLYAHTAARANYGPQLWAIQNLLSHGVRE